MEILQVIIRSLAAGLCAQHLVRRVALATLVDIGEVAEEQPRAVDERE
jgi:dimeric dUTPase (all-alpha-NTP-PPase superfamily)